MHQQRAVALHCTHACPVLSAASAQGAEPSAGAGRCAPWNLPSWGFLPPLRHNHTPTAWRHSLARGKNSWEQKATRGRRRRKEDEHHRPLARGTTTPCPLAQTHATYNGNSPRRGEGPTPTTRRPESTSTKANAAGLSARRLAPSHTPFGGMRWLVDSYSRCGADSAPRHNHTPTGYL
eukprot:scaffold4663_cov104-Isochrysis_galbana.AAC.10